MFVILYYDVNQRRCNKMLKLCRRYLRWVQNSVFEGEISEAKLARLEIEIKDIIKEEDGDSVIIYMFENMLYSKRRIIGIDKKGEGNFL